MRESKRSALVIGAGPAGLISLKELLEEGIDALLIDAAPSIGGVYAANRIYANAVLTTSSNIVAFGCSPAKGSASPVMWGATDYMDYLNGFVHEFGLASHIQLSTRATNLQISNDEVSATIETVSELAGVGRHGRRQNTDLPKTGPSASGFNWRRGKALPNGQFVISFDHVVVCTGLNTHAAAPEELVPGIERFAGKVIHSSQLRGPGDLVSKRVLVVGAGESGADICLMAAKAGCASALSARSGPGYIIPRYAFGLPSDVDTCRGYHSLPRWLLRSPWHRVKLWLEGRLLGPTDDRRVLAAAGDMNAQRGRGPFQRFGCKTTSIVEAQLYHGLQVKPGIKGFDGSDVVFTDGSRFSSDLIVLCCGYRTRFPFLEGSHPGLATSMRDVRSSLFKRCIHPDLGTRVTFCGFARPGLGAIPPVAEMQARYIAGLLSGRLSLPSQAAMRETIAADAAVDRETFPDDAARISALTDYAPLMDSLAGLIDARPSLLRLIAGGHWAVAWKVLFSSLSAAQFRLHGHGSTWAVSAPAIAAYPTLPLPIVLWELAALVACWVLGGVLRIPAFKPLMK